MNFFLINYVTHTLMINMNTFILKLWISHKKQLGVISPSPIIRRQFSLQPHSSITYISIIFFQRVCSFFYFDPFTSRSGCIIPYIHLGSNLFLTFFAPIKIKRKKNSSFGSIYTTLLFYFMIFFSHHLSFMSSQHICI